ncbi:hypothetical protein JW879_04565 [candidate division WOR-3 bacterium]|nr:hypothetical protein [candidate division WOR-3 bacterium]
MKKTYVFIFLLLCFPTFLRAEWTQEEIETITSEIRKKLPSWKIEATAEILKESEGSGEHIEKIKTNEGEISIKIMGKTVLLDGKDISGNLGSKITYGDNSPIMEDVDNSQIAVGDQATAKKTSINLFLILAISLSIPLSVSFVFNIILLKKLKKERKSRNN